jgi:D-3-phosphoglycerate dehydrogenase
MKILIAPSSFGQCGDEPLDLLRQQGYEPVMNPYGRRLTAEEVVELSKDCVGVVAGVEPWTAEVMSQLPQLRCVSRCGVGMDKVDLEAAQEHGIVVRNTPDGPTRAVAELTLGLALALARRIPLADRNIRQGHWQKEIGNLLLDKLVGIVGVGRIGRAAAELFLGIGCRVCATDPVPDRDWLARHPVEMVSLEELLGQSDIVSLHLAMDSHGSPVIGPKELDLMKTDAFLLNLARGEAVDEASLYQALKQKRIAGAALDAFVAEPYHGPLAELDNVILTPHLGSYALEGKLRMEIQSVKNLLGVLEDLT